MYFRDLIPRLVEEGDDGNCGSAAVCDTMCLQVCFSTNLFVLAEDFIQSDYQMEVFRWHWQETDIFHQNWNFLSWVFSTAYSQVSVPHVFVLCWT